MRWFGFDGEGVDYCTISGNDFYFESVFVLLVLFIFCVIHSLFCDLLLFLY